MKPCRPSSLMAALRAEMAHFAVLCVMVLAIPLMLPVAKAHAFLSGLTICTHKGIEADPQDPLSVHVDCTCVVTCNSCTAGKIVKALEAGWTVAIATPDTVARWSPGGVSEHIGDLHHIAANAIRGPPLSV